MTIGRGVQLPPLPSVRRDLQPEALPPGESVSAGQLPSTPWASTTTSPSGSQGPRRSAVAVGTRPGHEVPARPERCRLRSSGSVAASSRWTRYPAYVQRQAHARRQRGQGASWSGLAARKAHEYFRLNASHRNTASSWGMASKIAETSASSPVHPARFHPGCSLVVTVSSPSAAAVWMVVRNQPQRHRQQETRYRQPQPTSQHHRSLAGRGWRLVPDGFTAGGRLCPYGAQCRSMSSFRVSGSSMTMPVRCFPATGSAPSSSDSNRPSASATNPSRPHSPANAQ